MFVALGGSPAARFKEAASLVGKLASTHKDWAEYVKLRTTSKKTTPSRTNITREGNSITFVVGGMKHSILDSPLKYNYNSRQDDNS